MPSWAPRPVPTMMAVGVARPSAQGQAMMSTATAAVNARSAGWPVRSHTASVPTATAITTGTKIAETRSASRWTGALEPCASETNREIWASAVSLPTCVASTTRRPESLTVAPKTSSPTVTSTGTDSPVSIDRSTAEDPSRTTPSVAIFSPGRTTNRWPTSSWSTGISSPLSSRACFAPSSRMARSAPAERRLARVSKYFPSSSSAVTAAAVSK